MPVFQNAGAPGLQDGLGEGEHPYPPSHVGGADAEPIGQVRGRIVTAAGQEGGECPGFVQFVEIMALEVLHHHDLERLVIIQVMGDHGRDVVIHVFAPVGQLLAGPPAALTEHDQITAVGGGPDQDRLEHPLGVDGGGQVVNRPHAGRLAGVLRIGPDLVQGQQHGGIFGGRRRQCRGGGRFLGHDR